MADGTLSLQPKIVGISLEKTIGCKRCRRD
jgi:hypothetical protein